MNSRRAFLRLSGLSAAAASLYGATTAQAATQEPAKRLIVISHAHGWSYDGWKIRGPDLAEDQRWSIDFASLDESDFSPALAPLYPHRHRLIALDGLSLATAELDGDGNRHDRGYVHAWTGNITDFSTTDPRSTSQSIDQLVAAHIARPDRLPSLELSLDAALEKGRPIAYGPTGVKLPAENTPMRAWQRAFGAAAGNVTKRTGEESLDFAYQEYKALAPRLDALERTRLETHFELVSGLRSRLDGLAQLDCSIPTQPTAAHATYDDRFDAFVDTIAAALACDVSRVVSFTLGEMPTAEFGADHISDKVHKGIAHYIYRDPIKYAAMSDYVAHHARQVARLVSTLEAIPDSSGGSLMDNTLIVWGSELGDGWHSYRNYCPVLIGGDWAFKTGRYHHWPHETPIELAMPAQLFPERKTRVAGVPHQKLLVSVAQAMGLPADHVGLEHVRGQRGDFISLRGPLDGLTA